MRTTVSNEMQIRIETRILEITNQTLYWMTHDVTGLKSLGSKFTTGYWRENAFFFSLCLPPHSGVETYWFSAVTLSVSLSVCLSQKFVSATPLTPVNGFTPNYTEVTIAKPSCAYRQHVLVRWFLVELRPLIHSNFNTFGHIFITAGWILMKLQWNYRSHM